MAKWRTFLVGVVLATVASLSCSTGSRAQGFNWTGYYLGVHVGASVTDTDYRFPAGSHGSSGFAGGLQGGYMARSGTLVYGLEIDATWRGGADTTVIGPVNGASQAFTSEQNWLMTVRPRLGVLLAPQALAYITGGLAFGGVDHTVTLSGPGLVTSGGSTSDTSAGWTLGGGLEWALDSNWSLKAEYLYVDLGTTTVVTPATASFAGTRTTFDDTSHLWRAGLNYKF